MSEEGVISNIRELVAGVERERVWIMTIGVMGIVFSIVFAATMFFLEVIRPAGLLGRGALRAIAQVSMWLLGISSVISIVAGVKVLNFARTWQKSYSNLKAAEKELEKRYFGSSRSP